MSELSFMKWQSILDVSVCSNWTSQNLKQEQADGFRRWTALFRKAVNVGNLAVYLATAQC